LAKSGWASSRSNCTRIAAASSPEFGANAIPNSFDPFQSFEACCTQDTCRIDSDSVFWSVQVTVHSGVSIDTVLRIIRSGKAIV
jgi:hypothetical protein